MLRKELLDMRLVFVQNLFYHFLGFEFQKANLFIGLFWTIRLKYICCPQKFSYWPSGSAVMKL